MSIASIDDRKITVGLDVGDRWVHACFLDADGEIVEEARLAATAQALRRRFGGGCQHRVVLEAGLHSPSCALCGEVLATTHAPRALASVSGCPSAGNLLGEAEFVQRARTMQRRKVRSTRV